MKKESIVYTKEGKIDLKKSIEVMRAYYNSLNILESKEDNKEQKQTVLKLMEIIASRDYEVIENFYEKEYRNSKKGFKLSVEDEINNAIWYERLERNYDYYTERLFRDILGYYYSGEITYISKIRSKNEVYYSMDLSEERTTYDILKSLEKYGKQAQKAFIEKTIKYLESANSWHNIITGEGTLLADSVEEYYDSMAKYIYDDEEVKEELKEYILLNAEPDESEDDYSTSISLIRAASLLKLINDGKSEEEIIKYYKSSSWPTNSGIVASIMLKFGKKMGVEVYKKTVLKDWKKYYKVQIKNNENTSYTERTLKEIEAKIKAQEAKNVIIEKRIANQSNDD